MATTRQRTKERKHEHRNDGHPVGADLSDAEERREQGIYVPKTNRTHAWQRSFPSTRARRVPGNTVRRPRLETLPGISTFGAPRGPRRTTLGESSLCDQGQGA